MPAAHQTTSATFHFDLRHVEAQNLWVKGYRSTRKLRAHTTATRASARQDNAALAAMPEEHLQNLTHFAEDVQVSEQVPHHVRVHFDGDGWALPGLADMTIHVPEAARRAARAARHPDGADVQHATLAAFGVPTADLDTTVFADLVVTPLETAKSILFHHPELASIDPDTAAIVLDIIAASGGLNDFALAISKQGPATPTGGYATISPCVGEGGATFTYNPDGPWSKAGQVVHHYKLSEATTAAVGQGPLREALTRTKQEVALQNKKWAVNKGTPSTTERVTTHRAAPLATPAPTADLAAAATGAGGYTFTINNKTPGHGLDVENSSLSYVGGTFSLAAKNVYLRSLSAYVMFRDDGGTVLTDIDGFEGSWGGVFDFPSDGKYFLSLVTAVNTILGIPMPTDPTTLSFDWPEAASEADLLWGGIGTSNWDGDVVVVGFIATGIFQYGVPVIFLAAGAAIESSAWYKKLVEDKELMLALKAVGAFLFAGKIAVEGALSGVKSAMASLGDAIAGILVSAGVEKLAAWVFTKIAVSEAEDSVPFVGWAVRVFNMVTTAAQIAETTIEVLTSPATYTVQVKRQLTLKATVHPDPTHGRTPADAVWPTEADHWLAIVQYKDGTNYQKTGPVPVGNDAADPVVVVFDDLPAGSQLQVTFGVYSDTDWLAGRWQGAWVDAVLPAGGQLTVEGSIQENLVPLTGSTQYHYKQKTAWDDQTGTHVWHVGDQPTATVADLDGGNVGDNLGGLVGMTLNDQAYMLGYCWTASGQKFPGDGCDASGQMWSFANMGTLANPSDGYKFSECGFSDQPFLVYDQFGPAPLFNLPAAVEADLDAATVTPAIEEAFAAANYPITNAAGDAVASITVVTATAEWTVAVGATKLYEVRRVTDDLQVYAWPQPPYSPNNFYADPKLVDGVVHYYLRQVVLDETTPFGVDQPDRKAFGKFTIPNMDAFAVHPSGYVVAASWTESKLQVLKLPAQPVADADAEPALFLSGEGVRQGLLHGPTALAVSADGRILVLETVNQRIQAFDINGNPVHCFDGDVVSGLSLVATDVTPDLDAGVADLALREAFTTAGVSLSDSYRIGTGATFYTLSRSDDGPFTVTLGTGQALSTEWTVTDTATGTTYQVTTAADGTLPVERDGTVLFSLVASDAQMLDLDAVGAEIIAEFAAAGHALPEAAEVKVVGNGFQVDASVATNLAVGTIPDALRTAFADQRGITLPADATVVPSVTVEVGQAGKQWILTDTTVDASWKITAADDATTLGARAWNPTMALHVPDGASAPTYLDLATELKGYLYVLGHTGGQTPQRTDYFLDIYTPTGVWLSRTPDGTDDEASNPNAAKMIVDQWRTMFTLNYEHYQGGHGTEPSVSEWTPSTPTGG